MNAPTTRRTKNAKRSGARPQTRSTIARRTMSARAVCMAIFSVSNTQLFYTGSCQVMRASYLGGNQ